MARFSEDMNPYQPSDFNKFKELNVRLKNGILEKNNMDLDKARKIFIDSEVFKYDWVLVAIDIDEYNSGKYTPLVLVDDRNALLDFYLAHFRKDLFVGYNIKGYDLHVFRCLLEDHKSVVALNNLIISGGNGYMFDRNQNLKWPMDVYDIIDKFHSLKQLEAFMGSSIMESSVDFTIDRKLTSEEIQETIEYCTHDVEQGIEVFNRKINDYNATKSLIETFELPSSCISKTHAQLSAMILECDDRIAQTRKKCVATQSPQICYDLEPPRRFSWDEWMVEIAPTIKITKYPEVIDFFKNNLNCNYDSEFETLIAGIPHKFGFGGIHGCIPEPVVLTGNIWHVDVNSYYPSLMIQYGLLTRNTPDGKNRPHLAEKPLPETNKYVQIYNKRLQLKHEGKKKEQAPYKIVLNGTYGITKDETSSAYDPKQANNICINGQLMLVDLLEKLEDHCQVIQSNTDGIIIKIPDGKTPEESQANEEKVREICKEWEDRTHMGLAYDKIEKIAQKDVNNFIMIFDVQKDANELLSSLKNIYPNAKLIGNDIIMELKQEAKDIIQAWSKKTGLKTIDLENGIRIIPPVERKGIYLKELNDLDNDLPIINKALFEYLIHDVPVEDTIGSAQFLKDFQKVVKVSNKFEAASHNGKLLINKTYRIFASKSIRDGALYKTKTVEFKSKTDANKMFERQNKSFTKEDKFGNTPDHCFIVNSNVNGVKVSDYPDLDIQWYVNESKHRLSQFGLLKKVKSFTLFQRRA